MTKQQTPPRPTGEEIAFVSTQRRGQPRWTELAIVYAPQADGRCFWSQISGLSTMQGEATRQRAVYVGTIERALELFDQDSDATQALRVQALDWQDRNPERAKTDVLTLRAVEGIAPNGPLATANQPDGYQGSTLLQAVHWLYGSAQAGMAQRLADDFGVPRRTVAHALDQEQSGQALTGWTKAFISSLRFFNRAAFHMSREGGDHAHQRA